MSELTVFTNQLLSLAAKELSSDERDSLSQIIASLFNDLDLGHSCSIFRNNTASISVDDNPHCELCLSNGIFGHCEPCFSNGVFGHYEPCFSNGVFGHYEPCFSNGVFGHCEPCFSKAWQSSDITNLLLKSKLAYEYTDFPSNLHPVPVSILNINDKKLVYITKYLQYELDILNRIRFLSNPDPRDKPEDEMQAGFRKLLEELSVKSGIPNNEQLQSIYNSLKHKFSIITGGPGTGKTTTVAILLWLIYQSYGGNLKIKICAPTGKSSKRVKDSIQGSVNNPVLKDLDFSQVHKLLESRDNFLTIHKLLGYQANSIYFRHNKNNLLDLDILIIDECSMVSLPLFSKLLQAIDTDKIKHVILLGDKNQLSSVEEGYVFASLVNAPSIKQHVTSLVVSNRSNKEISDLAAAIQAGRHCESCETRRGNLPNTNNIKNYKARLSELFDKQLFTGYDNSLDSYFEYIRQANLENIPQLFKEFNRQTVLCLTNVGLFGTMHLNAQIEKKIRYMLANINHEITSSTTTYDLFSANNGQPFNLSGEWYTGRPIIILENDYSLELFNGDIGICIIVDDKPQIVFENRRKFIPEILPKYQVAYAITIHKSQGSEYEHVNLVLCDNLGIESMGALLTGELVYTGITRAKTSLSIFAGDKVLPYAISNKTIRNTGLSLML